MHIKTYRLYLENMEIHLIEAIFIKKYSKRRNVDSSSAAEKTETYKSDIEKNTFTGLCLLRSTQIRCV